MSVAQGSRDDGIADISVWLTTLPVRIDFSSRMGDSAVTVITSSTAPLSVTSSVVFRPARATTLGYCTELNPWSSAWSW